MKTNDPEGTGIGKHAGGREVVIGKTRNGRQLRRYSSFHGLITDLVSFRKSAELRVTTVR
jgi:hypothetical protein